MNRWKVSPSKSSIFCASCGVPRVMVTRAWVSPRVKIAEPCVRGRTPRSIEIGRISLNERPSRRCCSLRMTSRKMRVSISPYADSVAVRVRRVDDELAVEVADAHGADRVREGDLGDDQRGRGGVDGQDVGVVLAVGGEDEGDDLRLLAVALRERRPERAVDEARGQDLFLGGVSFAF